jgi:hypothetical protein
MIAVDTPTPGVRRKRAAAKKRAGRALRREPISASKQRALDLQRRRLAVIHDALSEGAMSVADLCRVLGKARNGPFNMVQTKDLPRVVRRVIKQDPSLRTETRAVDGRPDLRPSMWVMIVAASHAPDALEIEAGAKRRLADEYDAAQERGEVRGDRERTASNAEAVGVADVGLTHKDIHEARIIRDAEVAQPGVVRRTLDQAVTTDSQRTTANIRKPTEKGLRCMSNRYRRRQAPATVAMTEVEYHLHFQKKLAEFTPNTAGIDLPIWFNSAAERALIEQSGLDRSYFLALANQRRNELLAQRVQASEG